MAYLWRGVLRRNRLSHSQLIIRMDVFGQNSRDAGRWPRHRGACSVPMAVALHSCCRLSTLGDCLGLIEARAAGACPIGARALRPDPFRCAKHCADRRQSQPLWLCHLRLGTRLYRARENIEGGLSLTSRSLDGGVTPIRHLHSARKNVNKCPAYRVSLALVIKPLMMSAGRH